MIYIDSDGVLANWVEYVTTKHSMVVGLSIAQFNRLPASQRSTLLRLVYKSDPELFYHLKPTFAATELLNAVAGYGDDWAILTAGSTDHPCHDIVVECKQRWYKHHFGVDSDRVIVVPTSAEKAKYARPGDVLIDDYKLNCVQWEERGGTAILVTRNLPDVPGILHRLDEVKTKGAVTKR